MKFNSQIATSRSQSERLLALGLKKETADMVYQYLNQWDGWYLHPLEEEEGIIHTEIPAWSLHRLIEMMPRKVFWEDKWCWLYFGLDGVLYTDLVYKTKDFSHRCGLYYNVISAIEWLIKEGYFNKEYLV